MFLRNGLRFDAMIEHVIDGEKFASGAFKDPTVRDRFGVTIAAEPLPPADYSEDTYTAEVIDPAPYVVYTRRSDAEISVIIKSRIPTVVTMRQARLALLASGLLPTVNAAVAGGDEATKITWEFSSEVQRSNPLITTLAAALALTDSQLDDLFTLAATL